MFNKIFFALALFGIVSVLSAEEELAYRRAYIRGYDRYDDYRAWQNRMLENQFFNRYRYNYYEGPGYYVPGYYNPYYYTPYYPYGLPGSNPAEFEDIYEQNLNR